MLALDQNGGEKLFSFIICYPVFFQDRTTAANGGNTVEVSEPSETATQLTTCNLQSFRPPEHSRATCSASLNGFAPRERRQLDDYFMKNFTKKLIITEEDLHEYFLELDREFFDGNKIHMATVNSVSIQMAAYNLMRDWNNMCADQEEVRVRRILRALEAIDRQSYAAVVRQMFL